MKRRRLLTEQPFPAFLFTAEERVMMRRSSRRPSFHIGLIVLLAAQHVGLAQKRAVTTITYLPQPKSGIPLVDVTFKEGLTGTFTFDTGSDFTIVSDRIASRLRLIPKPLRDSNGKPVILFAGDQTKVIDISWKIGDFPFEGPVAVLESKRLSFLPDTPIDGILGTSVLDQLAVMFDFQKHQITLWYPGALSSDELKRVDMADAAVIPKTVANRYSFYVTVRLNDQVDTDLVIDTGADDTYIPTGLVKQLNLKPSERSLTGSTIFGLIKTHKAIVKTLAIGSLLLKDREVQYCEQDLPHFPPHIGMDILSRYRVLIDYPARKLYLKTATTNPPG